MNNYRRKINRILSVLLSIAMLVLMLPVGLMTAFADEGGNRDGSGVNASGTVYVSNLGELKEALEADGNVKVVLAYNFDTLTRPEKPEDDNIATPDDAETATPDDAVATPDDAQGDNTDPVATDGDAQGGSGDEGGSGNNGGNSGSGGNGGSGGGDYELPIIPVRSVSLFFTSVDTALTRTFRNTDYTEIATPDNVEIATPDDGDIATEEDADVATEGDADTATPADAAHDEGYDPAPIPDVFCVPGAGIKELDLNGKVLSPEYISSLFEIREGTTFVFEDTGINSRAYAGKTPEQAATVPVSGNVFVVDGGKLVINSGYIGYKSRFPQAESAENAVLIRNTLQSTINGGVVAGFDCSESGAESKVFVNDCTFVNGRGMSYVYGECTVVFASAKFEAGAYAAFDFTSENCPFFPETSNVYCSGHGAVSREDIENGLFNADNILGSTVTVSPKNRKSVSMYKTEDETKLDISYENGIAAEFDANDDFNASVDYNTAFGGDYNLGAHPVYSKTYSWSVYTVNGLEKVIERTAVTARETVNVSTLFNGDELKALESGREYILRCDIAENFNGTKNTVVTGYSTGLIVIPATVNGLEPEFDWFENKDGDLVLEFNSESGPGYMNCLLAEGLIDSYEFVISNNTKGAEYYRGNCDGNNVAVIPAATIKLYNSYGNIDIQVKATAFRNGSVVFEKTASHTVCYLPPVTCAQDNGANDSDETQDSLLLPETGKATIKSGLNAINSNGDYYWVDQDGVRKSVSGNISVSLTNFGPGMYRTAMTGKDKNGESRTYYSPNYVMVRFAESETVLSTFLLDSEGNEVDKITVDSETTMTGLNSDYTLKAEVTGEGCDSYKTFKWSLESAPFKTADAVSRSFIAKGTASASEISLQSVFGDISPLGLVPGEYVFVCALYDENEVYLTQSLLCVKIVTEPGTPLVYGITDPDDEAILLNDGSFYLNPYTYSSEIVAVLDDAFEGLADARDFTFEIAEGDDFEIIQNDNRAVIRADGPGTAKIRVSYNPTGTYTEFYCYSPVTRFIIGEITAPKAGDSIEGDYFSPDPDTVGCAEFTDWYRNGEPVTRGSFESGSSYSAVIYVMPFENYYPNKWVDGVPVPDNGAFNVYEREGEGLKPVKLSAGDGFCKMDGVYAFKITYPGSFIVDEEEYTPINEISLGFEIPYEGDLKESFTPVFNAEKCTCAGYDLYRLNKDTGEPEEFETFTYGETYILGGVKIVPDEGAAPAENICLFVNGNETECAASESDRNHLVFAYEFTPVKKAVVINEITLPELTFNAGDALAVGRYDIDGNAYDRSMELEGLPYVDLVAVAVSSELDEISDTVFEYDTVYKLVAVPGVPENGKELYTIAEAVSFTFDEEIMDVNLAEGETAEFDITVIDDRPPAPVIIPGDINGDDGVDNRDLLLLRRYLSDNNRYKLEGDALKAADFNQDGEVNNRDLLMVRRFIAAN